ncbi:hypothetical protein RB195_009302 [Necator americanus]|uniref:Saposin B-type domain-containing protein n=1 Tax=Necator americanus TaxID=51031 RepID=A0ABR1CW55_NECAM
MAVRLVLFLVMIGFVQSNIHYLTCVFCELSIKGFDKVTKPTPIEKLRAMFSQCDYLGLARVGCVAFVKENVNQILFLERNGVPRAELCVKLLQCSA